MVVLITIVSRRYCDMQKKCFRFSEQVHMFDISQNKSVAAAVVQ